MYSSRLKLMSSHIHKRKLEYDEIIALYKRKQLCNQFQKTNNCSQIMSISFFYTSISRWSSYIAFSSTLLNDNVPNKATKVL